VQTTLVKPQTMIFVEKMPSRVFFTRQRRCVAATTRRVKLPITNK